MRNAKIIKFIIPSLLLMGFGWWFYGNRYNSDKKTQELQVKKELLKSTEQVWDLWRNGADAKLFKENKEACINQVKVAERCSVDLLKCLLPKANLRINLKGKNKIHFSTIEAISRRSSGVLAPAEGARVVMGIGESKLTLFLEKSCHKIFLPKRNYGFGTKKNPEWNEQFDNFEQNIFIDKEMIPVEGRSLAELQGYCADRGMQLLESHILDAASFHPVDLRNNRQKYFLRPPLPWTRNFKSEYIYSAQNDPYFLFEKKYCNFIHTKECTGMENTSLPSWMGLRNPLGSLIEVVRNPYEPEKKLIPSSVYFPIHSKWHILGQRAIWSGEDFSREDFDFSPFEKPMDENFEKIKLGFRCMKEEFLR